MALTAVVGAGLLISTNEASKREKRVARQQEQARNVERAQRASEATQARRKQVREARLRRAEVENVAAASGVTGSSAAVAAGDALQNQLGSNVGDIGSALAFGEARSIAEQNILNANRKSGLEIWSSVGTQFALSRFGK